MTHWLKILVTYSSHSRWCVVSIEENFVDKNEQCSLKLTYTHNLHFSFIQSWFKVQFLLKLWSINKLRFLLQSGLYYMKLFWDSKSAVYNQERFQIKWGYGSFFGDVALEKNRVWWLIKKSLVWIQNPLNQGFTVVVVYVERGVCACIGFLC